MTLRRPAALVLVMAWLAAVPAFADTDEFTVTIKDVLLKNVSGEWVSVIRPDKEVNLVETEPTISFFNNAGRVPEGGYLNFKIVLSEAVRIQGRVKKTRLTRAGGDATLVSAARKGSDLPADLSEFREKAPTYTENEEEFGPSTMRFDFDGGDKDDVITLSGKRDFGQPLQVKKGSFIRVWFDVTLDDAVQHGWPGAFGENFPDHDVMYALPPGRVDELTLTIDDRVETLEPDAVVLDF